MHENIIVVSHRRSGTHLTIDAIINNFNVYAKNPPILTVTLDHLSSHVTQKVTQFGALTKILDQGPCVLKTHTHGNLPDFFVGDTYLKTFITNLFDNSKIIYVYRDGRDVLVSLYYYTQIFDEIVKNMSFSQFIRMENSFDSQTYQDAMDRPSFWKFHIQTWMNRDDILFLSFEELISGYEATIHKIANYLGQPVENIVEIRRTKKNNQSFLKKLFSKFVKSSHYKPVHSSVAFRKGKSGDWINHFSEGDLVFFEKQAGDINTQLGYN